MRTGTNHLLDDEPDDRAFRQRLAAFDEPAQLEPPADLVARTSRRLPLDAPAVLQWRQRTQTIQRISVALLFIGMATFGVIAMLIGSPAPAPIAIQLVLKPLLGIMSQLGLPLLLIGLVAALGSRFLLNRHAHTTIDIHMNA